MKTVFSGVVVFAVLVAGFALVFSAPVASAATASITLYGNTGTGWSATNASGSFSAPGPVLRVLPGQAIILKLVSADGVTHRFLIDLNNNSVVDPGELSSSNFAATTYFNFTLNTPGTYTYRCSLHPSTMWGEIVVGSSSTTPAPPAPDYTPYVAAVVVIAVIAIAAGVLLRRRSKAPPVQPPR